MSGNTPTYNLKAVIHETGLSPATLRAWERRYGLIKPQRSAGGHRLYTEHDIDMLKWLIARQAEGLSISHAVELWRSLEKDKLDPLQAISPPQTAPLSSGASLDHLRSTWVNACLTFNEQASEQALAEALAIASPESVCSEVLQKGLAEIGDGWYAGKVSVQQEHFASSLAMRRLHSLFAAAAKPTRTERILAACPPGEQHEFVLLLLSLILRRRGWDVVYLGANVPLTRLDATIQRINPRLVLSVAQTLNSAASLQAMAEFIYTHKLPLAFGGGVFSQIPGLHNRIQGHFLGEDLSTAPQMVERLLSQQPIPLPKAAPLPVDVQLLDTFLAKEALIISSVTQAMQSTPLQAVYLEEANVHLTHYITSALRLGDVHYLDYAVHWLQGLLKNYGINPALAKDYYAAFHQAVQQQLGSQADPILEWLESIQ